LQKKNTRRTKRPLVRVDVQAFQPETKEWKSSKQQRMRNDLGKNRKSVETRGTSPESVCERWSQKFREET